MTRLIQGWRTPDEVDELRLERTDGRIECPQALEQIQDAKPRQRLRARQLQHQGFLVPGSEPEGGRNGTGKCATLPPSSATILLTPCLRTSSIRITDCSGK